MRGDGERVSDAGVVVIDNGIKIPLSAGFSKGMWNQSFMATATMMSANK